MPMRLKAPVVLPCDTACSVLRDAVVDIDAAGRIVHCGPIAAAPPLPEGAQVRELTGILLPGLINTHAHTPMMPLRGLGGDLPLMRWLTEAIWPAEGRMIPRDSYDGMLLGSIEMLRAGVTTSVEMFFHGEHIVEAVLDTGARVLLTPGIINAPGLERLGSWQELTGHTTRWIDADGLRFGPADRIELGYGPHSAYTLTPEIIAEVAQLSRDRGALMHIHVAEALQEDIAVRAEHGSVPQLLEKIGALGGRVLAAHAVHLSDTDLDIFKRHDVAVAHCPNSNAKLASGTARLLDMRAGNLRVGLGTDGPASNDDLDIWDEVRQAALFARLDSGDAAALTAPQALLMATREGAAAIGRADIGALEAGRWADVVHVDVDSPAFPLGTSAPDVQLLSNLVWSSAASQVTEVWVAGEQVVSGHEPTRVDRGKAQAQVRRIAERIS
ncbi:MULTISPECIES: amidohydrolase [unclassified Crossiella]|uniref:amidohydrolase family protein n=1 Tax=unclassified Crossiella TaxID=2620835 RepID=UPI0020004723|nr:MULTISPECIES: amidohydrolase [unclassified Crossiella]MCK2236308.1 amidohydrolase [Crossiella sp. S99.2]MCK2249975.1 amidohydrolase [Crossiella sp. S99.1]